MKHSRLVFLVLLLFVAGAFSQTSDSTQKREQNQKRFENKEQAATPPQNQKVAKSSDQDKPLEGFIDTNGNGIDDRLEQKGDRKRKGQQQAKDRFIDADGDGICDGNESAIGLKKLYRKRRGNPGNR